jgi:NAD(P)H-hydrate epimerase
MMAEILLDAHLISRILRPRAPESHKGDYGHALIAAGSKGKIGAAVIAARACLRSGAGLLTVSVPQNERSILQTCIPEAMLIPRDEIFNVKFTGAGIGPGIGTDPAMKEWLKKFLARLAAPLILDADALNMIAAQKKLFKELPAESIITPHPKEFDRLFGASTTIKEREEKALRISLDYKGIIILKGQHTVIAQDGVCYRNTTGNAGLAKGGSGDMLTGMITAFLAQGYSLLECAQAGVFIHGLAADITLETQSMESMLASDVIENIGRAFKTVADSDI